MYSQEQLKELFYNKYRHRKKTLEIILCINDLINNKKISNSEEIYSFIKIHYNISLTLYKQLIKEMVNEKIIIKKPLLEDMRKVFFVNV